MRLNFGKILEKFLFALSIFVFLVGINRCYAGNDNLTWKNVAVGAGSTTLVAPGSSAETAVVKSLICFLQNACSGYMHTGTAAGGDTDIVGPYFYRAANSELRLEDLYFKGAEGETVSIWFSTDPGTSGTLELSVKTESINE